MSSDDGDLENQVELEEKTRLINQVLELQHTLEDLSARVDAVKEENLKLKSENQVLGQYIENLMSASSVFQNTDTKSKRKKMNLKNKSFRSVVSRNTGVFEMHGVKNTVITLKLSANSAEDTQLFRMF
ncbi:Short coiled-coil protein A [Channa argus]|uniref:Short coiled-coil protein A n=2 Tax=Channa argus TaxID=215402 RepID=A0A6G1PT62_CHAAH|nr:Short coiled-coil protein A [Channa argus]